MEDINKPFSSNTSNSQPRRTPVWESEFVKEICTLCRSHIYDLCKYCLLKPAPRSGPRCSVVYGACDHAFHVHCLVPWLKLTRSCPLDDLPWEFKQ